jgi:hypothetical protein
MKSVWIAVFLLVAIASVVAKADGDSNSFANRLCRLRFSSLAPKESEATVAAKARAARRTTERAAVVGPDTRETLGRSNSRTTSVDGLEVREVDGSAPDDFVAIEPEEFFRLYGEFDPKKIIKAKDVPAPIVATPKADAKKWYRSIIGLGDGHFGSVEYTIIETKPSGKVVIQFENPLHRGQVERREMRPSELQRGLKELEAPPKGLRTPPGL